MSRHVVLTFPHALGVPGGGTVHCRRLAVDLRTAGAEVTLLPVESRSMSMFPRPRPSASEREGDFLEPLHAAGISIRPLPQQWLGWWFDGLVVRRELARLIGERPVDAVLAWWAELGYSFPLLESRSIFSGILAAAPYSLWWTRRFGRPRWLHQQMDERLVGGSIRSASRVFANSAHTAQELVSLLGIHEDRIRVVHPPLSPLFRRPERPVSGKIGRLIFFGRLRAKKGIVDLVEALGNLASEHWRLRVAGTGDEEGFLALVRERGIEDRVEFVGQVGTDELVNLLEWAQVAVLPSYEESFGLSAAEAQLSGIPVVAYDAGAVGEVAVSGETGWLVPPGRVDLLSEALREALTDPEETFRRGARAREHAQRLLDESPGRCILEAIDDWYASRPAGSRGASC